MTSPTPPYPTDTSPQVLHPVLRALAWTAASFLALILGVAVVITIVGWNWLRAPVEHYAQQKTGRALSLQGDIVVKFGWPVTHVQMPSLTFANPVWARHPQMLTAQGVDIGINLAQLVQRKLVLPEVQVTQANIALERAADGRKSWLLDLGQTDENAQVQLGRVGVDHATVNYEDPANKTSLQAMLSTASVSAAAPATTAGTTVTNTATATSNAPETSPGLQFSVTGSYLGQPAEGQGTGGPVLALRDTQLPYPLRAHGSIGHTHISLEGTVTDLQTLSAADLHTVLRGDSLEQLYPLLGIAFPVTRPYNVAGRLVHSGSTWRFAQFTGRVGGSDLAGFAQVVTGGKRPQLTAEVQSNRLVLDDLGPVIGARPGSVKQAVAQPQDRGHVLPDLPFNTGRWDSVDADVQLHARSLQRARALPLENLLVHLALHDGLLTLNPLNFGLAGGQLEATVTLDGRRAPLSGQVQARVRHVLLGKLFPTLDLGKSSIGQVHGDFDLKGAGNSVGSMLAHADGKLGLVVSDGQISQLMMEKAGLHLWEILGLSLTGDRLIKLRCAVADFDVRQGTMQASALVLDTQVTTLLGTGSIDLKSETLDLTLDPRTKTTSPLSLRSPIYIRGSFAQPRVQIDKGRVITRAAGALGLGLLNPLLALIPLVDAGPGKDSDCGELVRDAKARP